MIRTAAGYFAKKAPSAPICHHLARGLFVFLGRAVNKSAGSARRFSAVITLCEITANRSHAAFAPNNRNVGLNDKNPSNARSECCGSSKP